MNRRSISDKRNDQNKSHAESLREQEAFARSKCTRLKFFTICQDKRCRRHNACTGDPYACWDRHWPIVPEEFKEWFRRAIKLMAAGMPAAEASRTADAEVARIKQELADVMARHSTLLAPSPRAETPAPRLRRL